MNGSGKQSYYEIQLSNGSLIAAFLVAAAVGVTVFVLGVMVGRGQAPETLPEAGWVEALAADDGAGTGDAALEEAAPIIDESGTVDPESTAAGSTPPSFEDVVADDGSGAGGAQPSAPAGLPADDPSLANGWVIQVKATADQSEARALQAQLSQAGFPTFVVQDTATTRWRVRVGRYGTQADAQQVDGVLSGWPGVDSTWVTQG